MKDLAFVKSKSQQAQDYYEEETRPVLELTVDQSTIVEKPADKILQQLYEAFLTKAVNLISEMCQDETSIIHKTGTQRLYNLLMTVVVNDTQKSKKVSGLLGQGFY